jgi:ubiquinone/menaquinone biosynthesis C-methylase UbiE
MMSKETLKGFLTRTYDRMQKLIIPSFVYPQTLYERLLKENVDANLKWLDIGCGHQLLPAWRFAEEKKLVDKCNEIVGFDYDFDSLRRHRSIVKRVRGDICTLPFLGDSFDLITANMVVEHLSEPETQLREIHRILKPGGKFIFHTPNARGYVTVLSRMIPEMIKSKVVSAVEGRAEVDVYPTYYRLNTEKAVEKSASAVGFRVDYLKHVVSQAKSNIVLPLALFELLLIRLLMKRWLRKYRANLIAVLCKE